MFARRAMCGRRKFRRATVLVVLFNWYWFECLCERRQRQSARASAAALVPGADGGVHHSDGGLAPLRASGLPAGRPVDSIGTRSSVRPGQRRVERSISGRIALNQDVARCPLTRCERGRPARCAPGAARMSVSSLISAAAAEALAVRSVRFSLSVCLSVSSDR